MKRLDQSKWENAYFGGKVKFSNWADKNDQSSGFSEYAYLGTYGKWYSKDDCDVICIESKREIQPISVCHVNDCASTATCRSDSTATYGYKCVCNNIVLADTIKVTKHEKSSIETLECPCSFKKKDDILNLKYGDFFREWI